MRKVGSNFGGEQSGHIIFSDYAKTGDGLVSALQTIAYIVSNNKRQVKHLIFLSYIHNYSKYQNIYKKPIESIEGVNELLQS